MDVGDQDHHGARELLEALRPIVRVHEDRMALPFQRQRRVVYGMNDHFLRSGGGLGHGVLHEFAVLRENGGAKRREKK
jgi:hypothetical protein